ncbi:GntR family transcriptional regulator [Rhizosaccharibacter radicis]|uniref:GntR family transcriptional regulator n=1 Tax=Rhizosaccharibacter radicis TaxID=2782605 RepID=A0ABT1W3I6_9PROT|nr:GntR family transcriptional regulator [Acetobacteraceae bacterium KSS12]
MHDLVRDRILRGEMMAGDPIRQDALAAEFGISKIPLREALARLEQFGLVRSQVHRGYVVSALSAAEAEEVFALRIQLEPLAMAHGSLAADAEDRRAASAGLKALNESILTGDEAEGALNRDFHMLLVRPGAGQITLQFIERLNMVAERYTRLHLRPPGRDSRACAEHDQMLALWKSQRTHELQSLVRRHLDDTLNDLRVQLAEIEDHRAL